MIDSYCMSKNLKVSSLEDFFSTVELYESRLIGLKEIRINHNIALTAEKSESDLKFSMDGNHEFYFVRKF